MRLDHLAIAAETLDEGVAWAEDRLGVSMRPGGQHLHFGTHNRLLGVSDGIYLEVIAVDPTVTPDRPRWFGLDAFSGPPRLANWICEPDDFDDWLRHGMEAVPMARGDLRWDMGAPPDGTLPMEGGFPTVLRWHTDTPPGQSLPPSGCTLERLTVRHPQADALRAEVAQALSDARVVFETAAEVSLSADMQTPRGRVTL
ncbi:VOC family protein [Pseudooctadecabacter jejudonensis]|uniref:Glyoxalase-like domain-containing protein n=1 Tax=Pseudooctadecabacter jejudonensis TaxID=1391910 RepID=A0A1Y5SFI4_9RHOB|nr:VOC family protein [Pseudooctadecabacter jejudonensis]SLN39639.1 hypothetical protein PSJ8397_01962 [Pseudooctadecabacter jejudonensis]